MKLVNLTGHPLNFPTLSITVDSEQFVAKVQGISLFNIEYLLSMVYQNQRRS